MSPEEIMEDNDKLNKRINELEKNTDLTEQELNSIIDMQIVIEYNNSLLMDNRDMNKTASLDFVNNALSELITDGRSALKEELKKQHKSIETKELTSMKMLQVVGLIWMLRTQKTYLTKKKEKEIAKFRRRK